jgi:hypothetical protein
MVCLRNISVDTLHKEDTEDDDDDDDDDDNNNNNNNNNNHVVCLSTSPYPLAKRVLQTVRSSASFSSSSTYGLSVPHMPPTSVHCTDLHFSHATVLCTNVNAF